LFLKGYNKPTVNVGFFMSEIY